ncbi:MAG: hypothetical protein LAT51_09975, partial [Flavobacteriaceae bacterium]|nr:hypothetical protein [Flavobacteriaceae bacterium]
MKNKFLLLILSSIISFSCQEPIKNGKKAKSVEVKEKKEPSYEPIFLNLSPKLSYDDFKSKLNENPEVENGKFPFYL